MTLRKKYERVLYVDLDLHHGDGLYFYLFFFDASLRIPAVHEAKIFNATNNATMVHDKCELVFEKHSLVAEMKLKMGPVV